MNTNVGNSSDVTYHKVRTIICTHCLHTFSIKERCGNRFCSECNGSSRRRLRRKIKALLQLYRLPEGYRFKHITLTLKSESNARDMQKHVISAFRRLRQRQFFGNLVDGGLYVVEITGKPNAWHVHLHILCSSLRLPWKRLLIEWKKCSGGRGVYIQNCSKGELINYMTKYVSKTSLPPHLQQEASDALKGSHLFTVFGCFHNLRRQLPKLKPTCPQCKKATLELLDIIFRPDRFPQRTHLYIPSPAS